jgi:hypothetical protein
MDLLGLHNLPNFRQVYLQPATATGLIEHTLPEKPQSWHQQYRLTDKGQRWLRERSAGMSAPESTRLQALTSDARLSTANAPSGNIMLVKPRFS